MKTNPGTFRTGWSTESKRRLYPGMLAVLVLIPTATRGDLLTNGSFESPDIASLPAPNRVTTSPSGWAGSPLVVDASAADASVLQAHSGSQYVTLLPRMYPPLVGPGTPITQAFSTSVGGDYVLSWVDNVFTPAIGGGGSVDYTVVLTGSSLFPPLTVSPFTSTTWNPRSVALSLEPGLHILTFSSAIGLSVSLDSVSLEPKPSTGGGGTPAVPDSTSAGGLLVLAVGLVRCLAVRRGC